MKERYIIFFIATALPFQSYGYGRYNALNIENGTSFRYLLNDIDVLEVEGKINQRYLGKVGGSIFIYNAQEDEVVVIDQMLIGPMRIKTHNARRERHETVLDVSLGEDIEQVTLSGEGAVAAPDVKN